MLKKFNCRYVVIVPALFAGFLMFTPGCKKTDPAELQQRFAAAAEAGDVARAKAGIDAIAKHVKDGQQAIALIEPGIGSLLRNKKYAEALEIAKYLRSRGSDNEQYSNLACSIEIQCVVAPGKWDEVKPVFTECVRQLPDAHLARLMRYVFASMTKAKQNDLLKECTKMAITEAAGKQSSVDYAASKWADACVAEDKTVLPSILKELRNTTVSPDQIGSIFINRFYDLAGDKEKVRELCAIGKELIPKCGKDTITNEIKVKVLDGSFIIEDYDLAVSMLEEGIPGKDELWHAMSIPKVKAHRAQSRNQPREAVKYYREFMDCWKNSEKEEEVDPQTHITYSKEWILARNASRIADILASIPDETEAKKARDEAREYFKAAMEKAKEDEAALKLVTEEAAKVK